MVDTVAVPPPDDEQPKASKRRVRVDAPLPFKPSPPAPPPEPDKDLPFLPMGGELEFLAQHAVESGVDPESLPPAARAALEASKPRKHDDDASAPIRDRAKAMLAHNLSELALIAADPDASASDRIAAIRELGKIADVYEQAPPAPVQVTVAEVSELLAGLRAEKARRAALAEDRRRLVSEQGEGSSAPTPPKGGACE